MKNPAKLIGIILIVLASVLVGYYFGVNRISVEWKNYKPLLSVTNKRPQTLINNVDFSLFWDVWQKLENNYYDKTKIDAQKMLNGAISGLVQSLEDPFTVYLPPTQNTNFKQGLAGEFSGIGAELGMREKQIVVIAPLNGSPAQKSGVKAGDAIVKVDGKVTTGWSLSLAVEKIRGPKGTEVVLTITPKDSTKSRDIKITRDVINVKSVEGWIKSWKMENGKWKVDEKCNTCPKVAYIRLSQFGDKTNKEWVTLVNSLSLKIEKDKDIKGLILDLRNNPGGYLSDAVFIASEFLGLGKAVVIEENREGTRNTLSVSRNGLLGNIPVVVLINKGSASASEIVTAALIDHKRAKVVGETSFGKGTIQRADDLGNGAGLHITVAKWLTPNNVWLNGKGIKPDISIEANEKDKSLDLQLEKAVEELVK